ncbi:MAG: hypothetical protein IKH88_09210 [Prevotella sp.]|nr:hypothetical protein [Prevotella sp.]
MIGGEFHISAFDILKAENTSLVEEEGVYRYASGRAALFHILKFLKEELKISRLLLPDYLCCSILEPVKKLEFHYEFYSIDEHLLLDGGSFSQLYDSSSAVLIINYFGLQDLSPSIQFIRSIDCDAIILEDDVQAYYEFIKDLDGVDFKFTSLRKVFAVPEGGLVKTKYKLPLAKQPNKFGQYKLAAALLKSMRNGFLNDDVYLDISKLGSELINEDLEMGMNKVAIGLYSNMDFESVRKHRLDNARILAEHLGELGIQPLLPLKEDKVPLFLPIVLKNRDIVRRRMFEHNIFCPIHWPLDGMSVEKGKQMASEELSLIVDQRYGQKEMYEILSMLS